MSEQYYVTSCLLVFYLFSNLPQVTTPMIISWTLLLPLMTPSEKKLKKLEENVPAFQQPNRKA